MKFHHSIKTTISVTIINQGIPRDLKFGKNEDLHWIRISALNQTCDENLESTSSLYIHKEQIVKSECIDMPSDMHFDMTTVASTDMHTDMPTDMPTEQPTETTNWISN